jgi:light-regulated signal transduction histidine kinase (bacteriophytochrome)
MLTHELKTPLGTIQFSLATLKRAVAGDSESIQRIQRIDSSVKRMDDLIEHVANSNKIELSDPMLPRELMPASELIHEFMDEYSSQDKFKLCIEPGAAFLSDRKMLSLLLENLISNAVKYTSKVQHPKIEIGVEENESGIVFFIKDNGAGFDMEYSDKLFAVFQRLHTTREFEGNGVGLAIAQRIIIRHGGRIWANAKINEGASFFFTLPHNIISN